MSHNRTITLTGLIVWGVCALFFTYEFLLRTVLGTFEHPLTYDLNLTVITFAILSSTAYQAVYGLMQIPVGIIIDRAGLKKTLFVASLVCALAVLGFSLTHRFQTAFLFRILMGFGSSFGFIGLLVAVYDWMPRQRIGLFIGLSQFLGTLGPMIAAGPLDTLASHSSVNWRFIFYCLTAIGFFTALLILLLVKNNKDYTGSFQILQRPKPLSSTLFQLMRQPQAWIIASYSALVYFTIEYLSENSGKAFLILNGIDSNTASYLITTSWLGYAIGCPLLGYISDLTGKRKHVMVLSALCCLISGAAIFYYPINVPTLSLAFIILGIGASGQSIGFAIMAEQCSENYIAAGLGLNNAIITLTTSVNAPVIGWMLARQTQGKTPSIANYQHAFGLIMILMLVALVLSVFFIKETFCKSTKETTKLVPGTQ